MSNMTRIGLLVFTGVVTCATVLAQEKCEIAITFPGADGKVGAEDTVKGKARNLPNGAHLWVLTHRKGIGLWWPQGGGEGAIEKGEWNVFVTFGEARDQGRQFEILAVVVDEPTHANLNKWVADSAQSGHYNGIPMPRINGGCEPKKIVVTKSE